jgi:SMC interacting uncharacterized protein involved in chromosome segregation
MSHSKEIDMQPKRRGRPPKSAQQKVQDAAARTNGQIELLMAENDALRYNLTKRDAVIEYLESLMFQGSNEDASVRGR